MALIFRDTFTDTGLTALTAHIPDVDAAGAGWSGDSGGGFRIHSDGVSAALSTAQNNASIITATGVADQVKIRVTLSVNFASGTAAARDQGICFRRIDSNNFMKVGCNSAAGVFRICHVSGGTAIIRASVAHTAVNGDVIEVTLDGDNITATINGTKTLTWNTPLGNTLGNHGLTGRDNSNKFDNFEIETVTINPNKVEQGFEGTGFDNGETWVTDGGTTGAADPDWSTNPLVGSQSLRMKDDTTIGTFAITKFLGDNQGLSQFYGRFAFKLIDPPSGGAGSYEICQTYAVDGPVESPSAIEVHEMFWITSDGLLRMQTQEGPNATGTTQIQLDTVYYVWFFINRTTTQTSGWLKLNTVPVEPESNEITWTTLTISDATSLTNAIGFTTFHGSGYEYIIDDVIVSTQSIPSPSTGVTGDLSKTLDPVTLSSGGSVQVTGDLSTTPDSISLSASGTVGGGLPTITGDLSAVLGAVTLGSQGKVTVPPVIFRDDFYDEHPRWDWNYGQGGGYNDVVVSPPTWHHGRMAIGATPSGYADGNIHEASVSHSSSNRYVTFRIQPWDLGPGTQGWGMWNANDVSPSAIWFWWADANSAAPLQGLRMMVTSGGSVLFNQAVDIPGFDMLAWHEYRIERLPGGAKFYIDGNLEGEYTGTMPTGSMRIEAWLDNAYYPDGVTRNYTPITLYQYIFLDWVEYGEIVPVSTGDLNVTIGPVSLSATGQVKIAGSLDTTLDPVSLSGDASLPIAGSADVTLDPLTLVGDGSVAVSGGLDATQDPITLTASATGVVTTTGDLDVTLDVVGLAATGSVLIAGSLDVALDPVTLQASSESISGGSLNSVLDPVTLSASATSRIAGGLNVTLGDIGLVAVGSVAVVGDLDVTLDAVLLTALGGPVLNASLDVTLDAIVLGATGKVRVAGGLRQILDPVTLVGNVSLLAAGGLVTVLDVVELVAVGKVVVRGGLSQTLGAILLSANGSREAPRGITFELAPRRLGWYIEERDTAWIPRTRSRVLTLEERDESGD